MILFGNNNTFDDFIEAFYNNERNIRTDLTFYIKRSAKLGYSMRNCLVCSIDMVSKRMGDYFLIDTWTKIITWLQDWITDEYRYYSYN